MGKALASKAGVILASRKLESAELPLDPRVLWVTRCAVCVCGGGAQTMAVRCGRGVHASAVVGQGVTIGVGTSDWAGGVLEDGVVVGSGLRDSGAGHDLCGDGVGRSRGGAGGRGAGVYGVWICAECGDGEYLIFPQQGRLVVEDDVEIGANTTIDRGALGETRIGRGTKIDNLVHIGHNCVIGKNVIIAAQTGISGSSVVEDGAILGGQVGIGEHATVGAGVILGGGAGVLSGKKMRGPGEVFWGRPARPLKEYLRDLARLKHR